MDNGIKEKENEAVDVNQNEEKENEVIDVNENEEKENSTIDVNVEKVSTDSQDDKNEKRKVPNALKWMILMLAVLTIVIALSIYAYAKYVTKSAGSATARVGNMICTLDVAPCSGDQKAIVNPYCDVTVKSFKGENSSEQVTDTSINYKVKVVSNENGGNGELPKYYWEKINGENAEGIKNEIVAGTADGKVENGKEDLEGTFTKGEKAEQKYRIVFVNTGETDVTKSVQFQLTATQADGTKKQ